MVARTFDFHFRAASGRLNDGHDRDDRHRAGQRLPPLPSGKQHALHGDATAKQTHLAAFNGANVCVHGEPPCREALLPERLSILPSFH